MADNVGLTSGLNGHWPLVEDCEDHSGSRLVGQAVGVKLGVPGPRAKTAAGFDGLNSHIVVESHPAVSFGTSDFTIAAWVRPEGLFGDVLSKFDAARRCGLTLRVGGSSPGYNSASDVRSVHFGIDNGVLEPWVDHGKPWPSNTLISTLTAFEGELYTGIADATGTEDAPSVFRFEGGADWTFCGRLDVDSRTRSVMSMIVHDGYLYAGTGTWDWEKSLRGDCGPTHVFRYEGGTRWTDCGAFGTGHRILSLASFDGELYAGDDTGKVHRFDRDGRWTFCGQLGTHERVNAMMVFQGHLYGAPHGSIFRYDGGTSWTCVGGGYEPNTNLFGENQTHTLQVFDDHLWAGMWPQGKVIRYEGGQDPGTWSDRGQLGIDIEGRAINEINDLTVYNGKLFAGVIPKAEVYRYETGSDWTRIEQLVHNDAMAREDAYSWNRVPCLTVFRGRLFAGTSTCHGIASEEPHPDVGRVLSMEAGRNVSFDGDLGRTWRHVAAVRRDDRLRLFVDGQEAAESASLTPHPFDLTNDESLLIGMGTQCHFSGAVSDLRVYNRALSQRDVSALMDPTG